MYTITLLSFMQIMSCSMLFSVAVVRIGCLLLICGSTLCTVRVAIKLCCNNRPSSENTVIYLMDFYFGDFVPQPRKLNSRQKSDIENFKAATRTFWHDSDDLFYCFLSDAFSPRSYANTEHIASLETGKDLFERRSESLDDWV